MTGRTPASRTAGLGAALGARGVVRMPERSAHRPEGPFRHPHVGGRLGSPGSPTAPGLQGLGKTPGPMWVSENLESSRRVRLCFNFLGDSSVQKQHGSRYARTPSCFSPGGHPVGAPCCSGLGATVLVQSCVMGKHGLKGWLHFLVILLVSRLENGVFALICLRRQK